PMATPAYVRELQQTSQPQGGGVTPTSGQAATVTAASQQYLAELQTTGATPSADPPTGQTTPPPSQAQKSQAIALAPPAQAPPNQTQYVTAEIQSSPTQSSSQNTPQYIVVTVTEGSLHSSDSVSDSSPPAAVIQTGVPTQVVQQVQTSQQRSVVQATSQTMKTEPGTQLNVTSLQSVHLTQENPFFRQRGSDAQRESEEKRQRQIENWLERRPAVVLLEKSTNLFGDSLSYASVSGGLLDCSSCFAPSLPVAYSPVTFSLPVMSVGWETDMVSYTSAPVPDVQTYFYEMPSAHSVQQQLQQVPVQHVYTNQVQYVEGGDANYTTSTMTSFSLGSLSECVCGCVCVLSRQLSSGPQVQWLLDNYETAEGVSLPRSTLYCHYLLHCQEQKLEPVNAASFGKLIRSVFMGLRTRRLGTRGNSKYHYYGLRIKASSSLLRLMEDQQHLAMRQQPFSQKQRLKPVQKVEGITNGMSSGSGQQQQQQQSSGLSDISTQVQQYQQFLDASRALPEFPDVDLQGRALPEGIELEHLKNFQLLYREHCEAILDVMVNLQFPLVETLWKTFWRFSESQTGDSATLAVHDESEKRLPKSCLVLLCKYDPVLRWSRDCDNTLYQGLVEMLIPDVLRPIPSEFRHVTSASAFAQTLRRYTSLNHLAQAARAVLQNTAQINQMLSDLNRVDFANVQEQASWVCRCEDRVVQRLEQDFKLTLQQQNSLEQWAAWLDGVVSQVLKPYQSSSAFPKAAKLFLLKWSFYSSMVIRDLTLRSAASFGSFHLIRLLYDEYMYYLIEHRVAQAKGETPIAVMGEFASLGRSLNPLDPDKEEEEEEEEDSDDECQELSLQSDGGAIGDESLEPPAKLARTDQRVLFTTGSMDN
ncbi:hypothetical protein cypCar_00016647, partial [Cyprinus carpio]